MRVFELIALVVMAFTPGVPLSAQAWKRTPSFVDLSYPPEALAARATGAVVVTATADTSGRVVEAAPLSGPASLRPAVLANVKQWTLSPGVRIETVVYRFEIDNGACNDDSRSLFRLVSSNLAVITACSGPGRGAVPTVLGDLPLLSWADTHAYPHFARSGRITGVVVLELSVDAQGAVTSSRALNELPFLSQAAVAHSKTWVVRTTTARRGIVVYEFAIDSPACEPETATVFWRITGDYVRLSACSPAGSA